MLSAIGAGATGMQRAAERFERSAAQVAKLGTERPGAGQVDPASEVVNQVEAEIAFAANAAIVRAADRMTKSLLDILV
jgi:flagellar hook protein FlgE